MALESLVGFDATDLYGLGGTFTDESNDDEDGEDSDSDATPNGSERGGRRRSGTYDGKAKANKTDPSVVPSPPKNRQLCLETMKSVVKNIVVKTFRFPTTSGEPMVG